MKNYFILLIAVIITTLFACQKQIEQPNVEKTINDLINKFPQLPKGKGKQTDYYKLIRSVSIEKNRLQLQLRSTPDSIENPQQIIIIINSKGQQYAIPFFSNIYRDYWNFQFDTQNKNLQKINTTFEKELITAFDTLNLNDTIGTAGTVINEIIFSLLHCRTIYESDSSSLQIIHIKYNNSIPSDESDSCSIRIAKNYKAILKEFHPKKWIDNYNAFWDEKNNRIYQFKYNDNLWSWRKKLKISIKVYRQDCVGHFLDL